jgi:hypothetical protein
MSIATLLTSHDTSAQDLGYLLSDIETALKSKALTQQEYVILMGDVERLRLIVKSSNNLQLDQAAHEAIVGVISLASLLKVL